MASSRLEKIGTIYSRTKGLLSSGAMKIENKPLWYDVYEAFPPKLEPKFDRPVPNVHIRKIFYKEDAIRAKYHKERKNVDTLNLSDNKYRTHTQQYIEIYHSLAEQGPLDEKKISEVANDILQDKLRNQSSKSTETTNLSESFADAKNAQAVNIKDIFND